jgi:hypothetical protein
MEGQDEKYSQEDFEKAWKEYAQRIPDIATVSNYILTNLPVNNGGHSYELVFSNIFQENEFKRLMTDLCGYMRKQLRNSSIIFTTSIIAATDIPRSNNPEEILRKMTDDNPSLELLKNRLKLEID